MSGAKRTIGIVGGMGPMATADMFIKLIRRADAARDQEHAHVIIDSNPCIPDRTAAILGGGESPVPELVRSCLALEAAGADVLLMACNTAYHFYHDIVPFIRVPMLNMPLETAKKAKLSGYGKCALLATSGTVKMGLYSSAFRHAGIDLITPDEAEQKAVMEMIYDGVKAGRRHYDTSAVVQTMGVLAERGAEVFILGCTELPIAFSYYGISGCIIDPTEVLAEAALDFVNIRQKQ